MFASTQRAISFAIVLCIYDDLGSAESAAGHGVIHSCNTPFVGYPNETLMSRSTHDSFSIFIGDVQTLTQSTIDLVTDESKRCNDSSGTGSSKE
jgi:hypothetical protein